MLLSFLGFFILIFFSLSILSQQLLECPCQPQEGTLLGLLFLGSGLRFPSPLALMIVWSSSPICHLLVSFILDLYHVFRVFGCWIIVCSSLFLWVPLWMTFYVFCFCSSVDYFLDSKWIHLVLIVFHDIFYYFNLFLSGCFYYSLNNNKYHFLIIIFYLIFITVKNSFS